jgi:hypothetical protein
MNPTESKTTVCTGDQATYRMAVYAEITVTEPTPSTFGTDVEGVKVEANADDASLGTFSRTSAITSDFSGGVSTADFLFKAGKKPGKTNLEFQGVVAGVDIQIGYVSVRIPIRVIDCKFSVSGALRFPADPAFIPIPAPRIVAFVEPVQLTADDDGHLSGSAVIHWRNASMPSTVASLHCLVTVQFGADGEVIVNGDVSDKGILTLTFEFPPATSTTTLTCDGKGTPGLPLPFVVDKVTVHIKTKGGTVGAPARYSNTGAGGKATFVVKKLK